MSSIESAPAAMPATRHPGRPALVRCSSNRDPEASWKVAATKAQMLVRLNSRRVPARWAVLPDGSYLTRISGVRLRVIDAQVTVTADGGLELGGEYRLATTLLDRRRYPAAELAFCSLRHTLQQGLVLRLQDPVGVQQEVWAQLTVYQVLRRAMTGAVESAAGTDPDRAAFTVALETAREQLTAADGVLLGPDQDSGIRFLAEEVLPFLSTP